MTPSRFDVLVVGAGPAGSAAALVLARGGASVALVDKARFPRDKACGDLVGPRGVRVMVDLGLDLPGDRVGDMDVVGPTGRHVRLAARAGFTYPGFGLVVPRRRLDDRLRRSALAAGAVGLTGRAGPPRFAADGALAGFRLDGGDDGGTDVVADVVIGADGALSRVAQVAGLVDEGRVLWGFALRGYVDATPPLPEIHFWEPAARAGYPGYGWIFPGLAGRANIGLGVGVRGDRRGATRVARDFDGFVADRWARGRPRGGTASAPAARLGGWLKMGMVGTVAARSRTLLVGDAAGLVNSLQGEGIAQALGSGRAAAEAVLTAGPGGAAAEYLGRLGRLYAPYAAETAGLTAAMLRRPRVVSAVGRLLTGPVVGRVVAGGWSVYWNDLLEGAVPGWPRRTAALAHTVASWGSHLHADRRAIWSSLEVEP